MNDKIEVCKTCNGTGIEYDGAGHTCTTCNGIAAPVVERQPVAWLTSDGRQLVFDGVLDQSQYIAHGMQPLYAGAPGPVAVVLPERLTPAELEELEVIEVLLHGQGLSNLAGTMAAARQFIDEVACLDKVKELNQ